MTTEQITQPETDDIVVEAFDYDPDDGDPTRLTHIVRPAENHHIWKIGMDGKDVVDLARLTQREVTALCGYKWIPRFNPDKYDVCTPCIETANKIISDGGS